MTSVALLIIRLTVGGLLAGHGAQKLFGAFGGSGIQGTGGWLESLGLRPGQRWAGLAGLSEFGGGVLTALGFLNPIGPILALGAMLMATVKVHAGRPIWVTQGGAELPITNMAVQGALIVAGPGRLSLDQLLGVRMPRRVAVAGLAAVAGVVAWANQASPASDAAEEEAGERLQGESPEDGREAGAASGAPILVGPDGQALISDESETSEMGSDEVDVYRAPAIAATDTGSARDRS